MRSKKEVPMKQAVCKQCNKIFETRKYLSTQPKYCTRACYAQSMKLVFEKEVYEKSVNAAPDQCFGNDLKEFFPKFCGILVFVIVVGYLFVTLATWLFG